MFRHSLEMSYSVQSTEVARIAVIEVIVSCRFRKIFQPKIWLLVTVTVAGAK
jgi:hypothetical protein